jgi:hypothetical protein
MIKDHRRIYERSLRESMTVLTLILCIVLIFLISNICDSSFPEIHSNENPSLSVLKVYYFNPCKDLSLLWFTIRIQLPEQTPNFKL